MKSKALEIGGEVNTVKSLLAGKHITDLIPALFFNQLIFSNLEK